MEQMIRADGYALVIQHLDKELSEKKKTAREAGERILGTSSIGSRRLMRQCGWCVRW